MTYKATLQRVAGAAHAYAVLNVPKGADLSVIKAAHRALAAQLHPDRNPDPRAIDAMARVNTAWDELSNPERRRRLNTLLHVAATVCNVCRGSGLVTQQKGFSAKLVVPCAACGGGGE